MAVEHPSSGGGVGPSGGVTPGRGAPGEGDVLALVASSPGGMIRAMADGEIGVPAGSDGGAERVAFERALRPACGRCLCSMAGLPSAGLRGKVEAIVSSSSAGVARDGSHVHGGAEPARTGASGAEPGRAAPGVRRGSRGRRLAMSIGATAILAFAAVAVYQGVLNAGSAQQSPEAVTAQLVSFMSSEHERTRADSEAAKAKFRCTDPARVCVDFSQRLGESPAMPELGGEHELAFVGAAPCGVPGGASIHVRFLTHHHDADGGGRAYEMSLFIQRDTGQLELEEGRVYTMDCAEAGVDATVQVWRKGTLVYYLVSDEAGECDCFRAAAGVGEPSGVVRVRRG